METIAIQIMLGGIAFRFYVNGRDDVCDGVDTGVDDESDAMLIMQMAALVISRHTYTLTPQNPKP